MFYRDQLPPPAASSSRLRFSLRRLFGITTTIAVALCVVLAGGSFAVRYFLLGEGPIYLEQSWPASLRQIENTISEMNPKAIGRMKVYCFENFINTGYAWRMALSPESYDRLKELPQVASIRAPVSSTMFHEKLAPWWDASPNNDSEILFWHGTDTCLYYDRDKEILYGYDYFDF